MDRATEPAPWRRSLRCLILVAALCGGCSGREGSIQRAAKPATSSTALPPGDEVSLSGRVSTTYGAHVFAVGSGSSRTIIVVAPPPPVVVGSHVEVTGRVRAFRRRELEGELGVDLGAEVDSLEDGVCLVATMAPGGLTWRGQRSSTRWQAGRVPHREAMARCMNECWWSKTTHR